MANTNHKQARDKVVRRVSAFRSYDELTHAMSAHGYIPTIRPQGASNLILRNTLRRDGLPVFPPHEVRS